MADPLLDILSAFAFGVTINFTAIGFAAMFRAFKVVGDAG